MYRSWIIKQLETWLNSERVFQMFLVFWSMNRLLWMFTNLTVWNRFMVTNCPYMNGQTQGIHLNVQRKNRERTFEAKRIHIKWASGKVTIVRKVCQIRRRIWPQNAYCVWCRYASQFVTIFKTTRAYVEHVTNDLITETDIDRVLPKGLLQRFNVLDALSFSVRTFQC